MQLLRMLNYIIIIVFVLCYSYQLFYIPISIFAKKKKCNIDIRKNNFAVLICARNEEVVICDLINSIKKQTYDKDKIKIFVLADNCTDNTAEISRQAGAIVYERFNTALIGKGYALQELMNYIKEDYPDVFDGYFVFDADNILANDYIEQMNLTFCEQNDIVTGYRNSKNYGDNWISAGYGLWFLRESKYLNKARYLLGTSCAVSGTGFLFSKKVANELNGWPFHTLTEDIEFSVNQILNGYKIAFCEKAELFDEQPTLFSQSWNQRLRWSRGSLQVFGKYGTKLIKGILCGKFSCFDISMSTMLAFFLSILSLICSISLVTVEILNGLSITNTLSEIGFLIWNIYSSFFFMGLITTVTEWKRIHTLAVRKLLFCLTFPIFMFTYVPISFVSIFYKTDWKPIRHTVSVDKINKNNKSNLLKIK